MYRVSIVLLVCVLGLVQCRMKEWTAEEFPNPQTEPVKCGRRNKPSYVCDPNGLISTGEADMLDHILLSFANDTKCPCSQLRCETSDRKDGYIMAVALVKKLKGMGGTAETVDQRKGLTRSFALNLLKKHWAYGKLCDEATIIVFSLDDGILLTLPGSSPSRYLKYDIILRIEREMARFFREGAIGQGLHYLVLNYRRVLDGEYYNTVLFTDVESAANIVKVSVVTSLLTSLLLKWFC